jgi:hypothetical protein
MEYWSWYAGVLARESEITMTLLIWRESGRVTRNAEKMLERTWWRAWATEKKCSVLHNMRRVASGAGGWICPSFPASGGLGNSECQKRVFEIEHFGRWDASEVKIFFMNLNALGKNI